MEDPNTFDKELKPDQGTEGKENLNNPNPDPELEVDYKKKFSESSSEALRLLAENKEKDRLLAEAQAEKERLARELAEKGNQDLNPDEFTETLYPGFEQLDPEAQENLIKFTKNITKKAQDEILKDPAIAFARNSYSEKVWDGAFQSVAQKYPELSTNKDDFKAKYFKAGNVPPNIEKILEDIAKMYLFDRAKEIGAREEKEKADRIELERTTGGDKKPKASRTLEEWARIARENPAQFAKMSKEYHADLQAGKLQE